MKEKDKLIKLLSNMKESLEAKRRTDKKEVEAFNELKKFLNMHAELGNREAAYNEGLQRLGEIMLGGEE